MKKIAAIFFLLLFSFNWFGYRLMFHYLEQQANEQLECSLNNHEYDESQLIEIKIPVHISYQRTWTSYQRYDGEIMLNNVVYKYVKRRLANDTLYLKCIPDTKKMGLQKAKNDFFTFSNNLTQNNQSDKAASSQSVFKFIQSVFYGSSFRVSLPSPYLQEKKLWLPERNDALSSAFLFTPDQPPDFPIS